MAKSIVVEDIINKIESNNIEDNVKKKMGYSEVKKKSQEQQFQQTYPPQLSKEKTELPIKK